MELARKPQMEENNKVSNTLVYDITQLFWLNAIAHVNTRSD